MALEVVSMEELKLAVLVEPERTGASVAEVCRRRGISRASYYRYRRRYLEEGVDGLEPRSRRPRSSPGQIDAELEVEIVSMRKRHPRWGARRIHAELARAGREPPAVATIHRALKRNHLVAAQPPRRRKADKRFERAFANDLWQIDATQIPLTDTEPVWVVDCSTTTPASCSPRSRSQARPARRPGPASSPPAPPTGCRASCSPTTG